MFKCTTCHFFRLLCRALLALRSAMSDLCLWSASYDLYDLWRRFLLGLLIGHRGSAQNIGSVTSVLTVESGWPRLCQRGVCRSRREPVHRRAPPCCRTHAHLRREAQQLRAVRRPAKTRTRMKQTPCQTQRGSETPAQRSNLSTP